LAWRELVIVCVDPQPPNYRERKEKKEKERYKKSRKRYISFIRGKPPVNWFSPIFAHREICRTYHLCKFRCEKKLRETEIYGGQILEFPIEMAGHAYNSDALSHSLW